MNDFNYDNNLETKEIFNELVSKLDSTTISFEYLLEFITIFRSSDPKWYYKYVTARRSNRITNNIEMHILTPLIAEYLGYDSVTNHEIEIATFLINNLFIHGYCYHLTNNYGMENIKTYGLNVLGKKEMNEDIRRVANLLTDESRIELFKKNNETDDMVNYYFSVKPVYESVYYGTIPEWFYIFTRIDPRNLNNPDSYEKSRNEILRVLNENGDSEVAKQAIIELLNKYWILYANNNISRNVVMIPNNYYLNYKLENFMDYKDNLIKDLNKTLSDWIFMFYSNVNANSNKPIPSEDLLFIDCKNLNMDMSHSKVR